MAEPICGHPAHATSLPADPMEWPDDTYTRPCRLDPGVHLSMPQGHALVADGSRYLTVLHLGGVVQVGSITVRDPDVLVKLADHLLMLADRLRREPEEGPTT